MKKINHTIYDRNADIIIDASAFNSMNTDYVEQHKEDFVCPVCDAIATPHDYQFGYEHQAYVTYPADHDDEACKKAYREMSCKQRITRIVFHPAIDETKSPFAPWQD